MRKEIGIGFLIAIIGTLSGSYLFVELFSKYNFYKTVEFIQQNQLMGKVLVLGSIVNLFIFFVFIKKKQIYRARGVILETFLIAFFVLLLTLIGK